MTLVNLLHQSIFQELTNDELLMTLITGVFDRVIQSTAFPYISLGESTISDWSSKTTTGKQANISLHIWSREGGRKQAITIMERVYTILQDTHPEVSGHTVVLLRFADSRVELMNDGCTYKATIIFKSIVEQTS